MRETIIALMEDKPGALSHVVTLFRRRNYNIESLAVGHSEVPGVSRMTVVAEGDKRALAQIVKHLNKLVNVIEVSDVTGEPSVIRELALIKVGAAGSERYKIVQLADIFRGWALLPMGYGESYLVSFAEPFEPVPYYGGMMHKDVGP